MSKIIPQLKYRAHCARQGREGCDKPLTRKQAKALRQHSADTAGREAQRGPAGYKAKVTTQLKPVCNILGEVVRWDKVA